MKTFIMLTAAAAAAGAFGMAAPAAASKDGAKADRGCTGPAHPTYRWQLCNGKRAPYLPRTEKPDGSWETKADDGKCIQTRKGRDGEFIQVNTCD